MCEDGGWDGVERIFFFFEKMIFEQNSGRISKEKNILGRLEE